MKLFILVINISENYRNTRQYCFDYYWNNDKITVES